MPQLVYGIALILYISFYVPFLSFLGVFEAEMVQVCHRQLPYGQVPSCMAPTHFLIGLSCNITVTSIPVS